MKTYNLGFLILLLLPFTSQLTDSQQKQNINRTGATNLVFRSLDGGQSWQDISEGLPADLDRDDYYPDFVANESGVYLRAWNRVYHCSPNSSIPSWENEILPGKNGNRIAPGNSGLFSFTWDGNFMQKRNGTNVWSPIFRNFHGGDIRSIFECANGTLFIGTDYRLYKSTNSGKSWKVVNQGGGVLKMAESNGVLMASGPGILRSADEGETWECVLNEGGVGQDIQPIKGGFAAIIANTDVMARTVRASYDAGKTWQPIDNGLPAQLTTASIIQVGDDFLCGHPDGIYRSSDKGKTWKLILPSIKDRVFNLLISGNMIYAIPRAGGC